MNSELELMIENFLSENAKSLKDLGNILDNVNKSYDKYSYYIEALKDGVITYIDFEKGNKLQNVDGKLKFDNQAIKDIKLIKGSTEESTEESEPSSQEAHIVNFETDKISDAGNLELQAKITAERNILDWLITKAYDPKFAGKRSLFDDYVKAKKNVEEFTVPFVNAVNSYSQYKNGVKLFYYNKKSGTDEPLKDSKGKQQVIKLGTEYTSKDGVTVKNANNLLALSIDDLFSLISGLKKDQKEIIDTEEAKFKDEVSADAEGTGTVGGESSLRKHFDNLIKKHPYHNKGEGLDYVLPGKITQFGSEWTLIEYTTYKDAVFWGNPSQDWHDEFDYPKCSYEGKWRNPKEAENKIKSLTKKDLLDWCGTTIAPFAETLGATWCTARTGSAKQYHDKGSVYLILKNFKKYIQYMPSDSQFEFWNDNQHATTPTDQIKEIIDNVPPFVEHCIEGGKDNMIPTDKLYTYYQKSKELPSIAPYMRLYSEKYITSEELITELSSEIVEKNLYQIREKNRVAINPWDNLSNENFNLLLNAFKSEFKKNDDAMIQKIVKILGSIINGSSNFFIKVKFKKNDKSLQLLYDILNYMMEKHPKDKSTKLLFETFSNVKKVDLKKIVNLTSNEDAIFSTAKTLSDGQFTQFDNAEVSMFLYSGIIVRNIKDISTILNGKESSEGYENITLIKDLVTFFNNVGVMIEASTISAISTSVMDEEKNKTALKEILQNSENFYEKLKKVINGVLSKEGKNISVKNHRNLLLDSILSSKVNVLKSQELLELVENQLKTLKINIAPADIHIPLMDIDYFDRDKDSNLVGLSLLISILNSKHEIVNVSSVVNSDFSLTDTLQSSGVITPADNGKYYLSQKQYSFLSKEISSYLKKDIFDSKTLKVDDSYFAEVKQKGLKIENANPLEILVSKLKSNDLISDYKDSLLELLTESMDKKTITDLGSILNDYIQNVGDYLFPKVNLMPIYEKFVSQFKTR